MTEEAFVKETISLIQEIFGNGVVPGYEPTFEDLEEEYVLDAVRSTFVATSGVYIEKFKQKISELTGADFVFPTNTGTSALHLSLIGANVKSGDFVLTQPTSFVATTNAIMYQGAEPLFIDIDESSLALSPSKLKDFLANKCEIKNNLPFYKGRLISACVPVHILGHPFHADEIAEICKKFSIPMIEDAAAALGSSYKGKHVGNYGLAGIFSFNGNKIVTAGGGGAIVTNNKEFHDRILHLGTTAKVPHPFEYRHDEVGYNYRLPNLNAALVVGQLERFRDILERKQQIYDRYKTFFSSHGYEMINPLDGADSNHWLPAVDLRSKKLRDMFLEECVNVKILAKALWNPITTFSAYQHCVCQSDETSKKMSSRVAVLPGTPVTF